jgi:hypothetical protein
MFLHGDNGNPDSQLECDLYTADILHAKFEGLGVRGNNGEDDFYTSFDALSYTWGVSGNTQHITCDGHDFTITENLFDALRMLRLSGFQAPGRYVWVDSICINQASDDEKGHQVWNMFTIYQKASQVIAWLGPAPAQMDDVMAAVSSIEYVGVHNVENICTALLDLYTRSWFRRMWVQQELFAARKLHFQCGPHHIEWSGLLSKPTLLLESVHFAPYVKAIRETREFPRLPIKLGVLQDLDIELIRASSVREATFDDRHNTKEPWAHPIWYVKQGKRGKELYTILEEAPNYVQTQLHNICELDNAHTRYTDSFRHYFRYSMRYGNSPPDFVDTLLHTGILNATNPRDYIYAIIGMTAFPAKPIAFEDWVEERQYKIFLPIDYSAHLTSILVAVTWAALMRGGLGVLARFKTFSNETQNGCEGSLPSWVVDWRLAAELYTPKFDLEELNLRNVWQHPGWEPDCQSDFIRDNSGRMVSHEKLVVRGTIQHNFYGKGRNIWQKGFLVHKLAWPIQMEYHPKDLVVHLLPDWGYKLGLPGLWLLRPVGENEYRFIAYLKYNVSRTGRDITGKVIYSHWHFKFDQLQEKSLQEHRPDTLHHPLAVDPKDPGYEPSRSAKELGADAVRTFIIV